MKRAVAEQLSVYVCMYEHVCARICETDFGYVMKSYCGYWYTNYAHVQAAPIQTHIYVCMCTRLCAYLLGVVMHVLVENRVFVKTQRTAQIGDCYRKSRHNYKRRMMLIFGKRCSFVKNK